MKISRLPLALLTAVYFIVTPAQAIVRGSPVDSSHPLGVLALESLNAGGERVGICTGIMISPHLFLTAAHCVNGGGFGISKIDNQELAQQILISQSKIQASSSLDLAMGVFDGTEKIDFVKIDRRASFPDKVFEIRGYGLDQNDVDAILLPPEPGHETEQAGLMSIFALDGNLMTFRSRSTEDPYAVASDAGAPLLNVYHELVGIFIEFKMIDDQDQWGNCFLQNQVIRVSSPAAQAFITQAQANLGQETGTGFGTVGGSQSLLRH